MSRKKGRENRRRHGEHKIWHMRIKNSGPWRVDCMWWLWINDTWLFLYKLHFRVANLTAITQETSWGNEGWLQILIQGLSFSILITKLSLSLWCSAQSTAVPNMPSQRLNHGSDSQSCLIKWFKAVEVSSTTSPTSHTHESQKIKTPATLEVLTTLLFDDHVSFCGLHPGYLNASVS